MILLVRLVVLFLTGTLFSCATVRTEGVLTGVGSTLVQELPPYPPPYGAPQRVQVMQYRIPAQLVETYPRLAQRQVGLGLSGRLVDELYESGAFVFVEEKGEMQRTLLENWALSQSGIVADNQQLQTTALSAPRYLVYVELVDFSISHSESVAGSALERRATTRMTLQVRLVDIETGEFIPASATGEANTLVEALWVNPDVPFDQTTVGIASQRALRLATLQLLERMNKHGVW